MSRADSHHGTGEPLRVLLRGNYDLTDSLLAKTEGGRKLDRGLKDLLAETHPDVPIEISHEPCAGIASFRQVLESGSGDGRAAPKDRPHIVAFSLHADLMSTGPVDYSSFFEDSRKAIRILKQDYRSHVIALNASTFDPSTTVSNYRTVHPEPRSLSAHRLNLALMRLSFEEGISIVDADRLLAEMGCQEHVSGFLNYSYPANQAICREFHRILEDYGFLDERPLLMQVGRRGTG